MNNASDPIKARESQPTLYDVCRLSGVSSATVSRVFSGRAKVSDAVRQRVLDAAKQLSYEPSYAARALAGARTHTLGAVFHEIASGFYADVLAGIDEVAAERDFDVLASFVGKRRSRPEMVKRLLRQGRVDALLLLNLEDSTDLDPGWLKEQRVVLIDREIPGSGLPTIGLDNIGGAESMIGHLFEQGHRRVTILTGPEGNFDSEQRLLGCRRALNRLGLPLEAASIWRGAFTRESGIAAARSFLASGRTLPDAIFCLNDAMAIGVLGELQRSGLSVPRDVALAGYDDVEAASHLSLTSVASPMRLMGQMAARWAIDLITGAERPVSHRLQVRLVVRHSSLGRSAVSSESGSAHASEWANATEPAAELVRKSRTMRTSKSKSPRAERAGSTK